MQLYIMRANYEIQKVLRKLKKHTLACFVYGLVVYNADHSSDYTILYY